MIPIFRIAARFSNVSKNLTKCVFASSQTTRPVQSVLSPVLGQSDSSTAMDAVWSRNRTMMEGFQDEIPEFSLAEARRVMSLAAEYQAEGPSVQGVQENYSASVLTDQGTGQQQSKGSLSSEDVHSSVYSGLESHIDLEGSQQGHVPHPHPYTTVQGPYGGYMNMPGNDGRILNKFASASMLKCHPSRNFSTSSQTNANVQGAVHVETEAFMEDPAPQGVQGHNCVNFKLWMENCQRYNLPNCDEQLESIKAGRKTLAQVFQEQQDIIHRVAADYKKQQLASRQSTAGAQGLQDSSYNFQFSIDDPCPQGLQGDDCADYKFWAYNCKAFGFGDCLEKADDITLGRRTIHDVFTEQDVLIRKIVNEFKQRRSYSTESSQPSSGSSSEVGKAGASDSASNVTPSLSTPPQDIKLSQKDKLKRAVKEYGTTVIVFHIGISLMSLGGFYAAVSSGLDVVGMLSKLGVGESILGSRIATGSTTFVVAYAVHKVFAPVRIAITLTCTPLIVLRLRKIGFLKPPKIN